MTPTHLYGADSLTPEWTEDWTAQAACRGEYPDLFYPPHGTRGRELWKLEEAAKQVCADCPVITQCRDAGRSERYGVWGGLTPAERGYNGRGERQRAEVA